MFSTARPGWDTGADWLLLLPRLGHGSWRTERGLPRLGYGSRRTEGGLLGRSTLGCLPVVGVPLSVTDGVDASSAPTERPGMDSLLRARECRERPPSPCLSFLPTRRQLRIH